MTYNEAKSILYSLQADGDAAQAAADAANAALWEAITAINLAQSAVDAFHRYTCYTGTSQNVTLSNFQRPDDAEVSGDTTTVYRTEPPEPMPCDIQTYESGGGVWSDPSSFSLNWTDNGQAQ